MSKSYCGVGMRNTPKPILKAMTGVAKFLGKQGYTLRSGAAHGADTAFEKGCDEVGGTKEIYLPWKRFMMHESQFFRNGLAAMEEAEKLHPNWESVTPSSKPLLARNSYQVLGMNLDDPVKFVICYTSWGKEIGGTGQTIRVANYHGIPVINLGSITLNDAEIQIVNLIEIADA